MVIEKFVLRVTKKKRKPLLSCEFFAARGIRLLRYHCIYKLEPLKRLNPFPVFSTLHPGARCAREEVAAEEFVFQSPSVPCRLRAAKENSSFLNDDDSDAYAMEATQPFCQDPGRLSEDPTQDFLGKEEEDTDLILPRPSEQAIQMIVSGSASKGQQVASRLGTSTPQLPRSQPASQPAGGTAAQQQKQEEEAQLIHAAQIPSVGRSQPSTLAKEVSGSPKQEGVTAHEGRSTEVKLEAQNEAGEQ
nr:uncharacterized protein LOC118078061 [Zootoca vivipara]